MLGTKRNMAICDWLKSEKLAISIVQPNLNEKALMVFACGRNDRKIRLDMRMMALSVRMGTYLHDTRENLPLQQEQINYVIYDTL